MKGGELTKPVSNDEQWTINNEQEDNIRFIVYRPNDTGIFTVTERRDSWIGLNIKKKGVACQATVSDESPRREHFQIKRQGHH
jgi:hypothetical protein